LRKLVWPKLATAPAKGLGIREKVLPDVLALSHYPKVCWVVVVLVAVDVMNDLATPQRPTKHFFGYYSVLMPLMEFFVGARFCMGRNS